jgi:hypothetical protein
MTKTPTAEEVLGLLSTACDSYNSEPFITAYQQWQAAQGPVTREWFVERFGASDIDQSIHGWTMHISLRGRVEIGLHDEYGEVYLELHNPTRERIEALVEMLGGESCG